MVTVMTVYPTADDRNTSYSFIQEGSISEYKGIVAENYDMTIEHEKMIVDGYIYQIVGHLNYGWQPTIIVTIKELVDGICLMSDIYKCEDGNFHIDIVNEEWINAETTLSNPTIRIKNVYLDYTDDDEGYDDYNVYEIEILKW